MDQTNLKNVCLSVILGVYCSSCVWCGRIFDFQHCFFLLRDRNRNTAICLKKYHKNGRYLSLEEDIFAKISQNMCLLNTHILICQHARCGCKLWNASCFYYVSLRTQLSNIQGLRQRPRSHISPPISRRRQQTSQTSLHKALVEQEGYLKLGVKLSKPS